ncbi:putative ribonuclease H-like domain-containing protein [Tanacetum coccineum]
MKDMGEADVILGIKIKRENTGIVITQSHYIEKILKKFNRKDCSRWSIQGSGRKLTAELSRFTSNPTRQHWKAITRVFKYLRGTKDYGLSYVGYPSVLEGYLDASWINHVEDLSSTSGWFVALAAPGKKAEWLRNLKYEIPIWPKPIAPISIRCDSENQMARAYSQIYNGKSRHLGSFPLLEYFPTASEEYSTVSESFPLLMFPLLKGFSTVEVFPLLSKDKNYSESNTSFAKKKGRIVAITAEDMQKRKNDVKARTTLLLALTVKPSVEFIKMMIMPKNSGSHFENFGHHSCIDDDDIEEMDIKWNLALLSMRADRWNALIAIRWSILLESAEHQGVKTKEEEKATRRILKDGKRTFSIRNGAIGCIGWDWSYMVVLDEFKNNEIKFCERIRVLERDLELRDNKIENLRNELEEIGLPEFVDDIVTDYSRPTPSIDVPRDVSESVSFFEQRGSVVWVPTARTKVPTVGSKVPTAKPTVAAVKGNRGKAVKASACWIWKPKKNQLNQGSNLNGVSDNIDDKGYWDSGCSRHMTGNISYLSEYEPYDGGYVSFGHGGGKITGKDFKLDDDTYVLLRTPRQQNMYSIDLKNIVPHKNLTCLITKASKDESMLWHRRLGHLNFKTINKLVRNNLVKGLPSKSFENIYTCVASLKGKQHKTSWKGILRESIVMLEPLAKWCMSRKKLKRSLIAARTMLADAKLLSPFGLKQSPAICFLRPFGVVMSWILIPLDHLGKFDAKGDEDIQPIEKGSGPNWLFDIDSLTKSMNYVPVVIAGTSSTNISGTKEVANQTMEENVSSLRFIALPNWFHEAQMATSIDSSKKDDDSQKEQDKIISNSDAPESSGNSNPTATTKDVTADQVELIYHRQWKLKFPLLEDLFGDTTALVSLNEMEADLSNMEANIQVSPTPTLKIHKVHPKSQIIGPVDTPVQIRQKTKNMEEQSFIATIHQKTNHELLQCCLFSCFLSQEEPKKIFDALKYPSWVEAMQEELLQFKIQNVWMDVKSTFLYGTIDEEVYVMQPLGFQDSQFLDRVYKVVKAMYGLHQAPRAWYGTLSKYLLDNGFQRGTIDQTLFIRKHKGEFLLVQVYVDDIIFGSSNPKLCREFETLMHDKFKMSAMGELNFFLGLQVLQKKDGIFLSQDKYAVDILKKFGLSDVRSANTPMDREHPWGKDRTGKDVELHLYRSMIGSLMYLTASRPDIMFAVCHPKLGLLYPKKSPFDLVAYSDSDYGGATQDRKSTTRDYQFLGRRLISWQCKKQTIVATSTTEAEYVAAASGCG